VALWRTARHVKRLERRDQAPAPPDERAERLEQLVDSLTVQVEQLASGQDFLNRVVSERLDKIARGLPAPDAGTPQ
jgi:Mg2+ and Co2+ transporter CorA